MPSFRDITRWVEEAAGADDAGEEMRAFLEEDVRNPLRAVVETVGTPAEDLDLITREAPRDPKMPISADRFVMGLRAEIHGDKDPVKSAKRQRALKLLELAFNLSELFASKDARKVQRYYDATGLSDLRNEAHGDLVTAPNGVMTQIALRVFQGLGHQGEMHAFIEGGDRDFTELLREIYKLYKAEKSGEERKILRELILEMLDAFDTALAGEPDLTAVLTAIMDKLIANHKNALSKVTASSPKGEEAIKKAAIESAKATLKDRAPEAVKALEKLYALKKLKPERVFEVISNPAAEPLLQVVFGINQNDFYALALDEYNQAITLLNNDDPIKKQATAHLRHGNAQELCEDLFRTTLGIKIRKALDLKLGDFCQGLNRTVDRVIGTLMQDFPPAVEAKSFDDMLQKLVASPEHGFSEGGSQPGITMIGHRLNAAYEFMKTEPGNAGIWTSLNDLFDRPDRQGDTLTRIKSAVERCCGGDEKYQDAINAFNALVGVMKGKINIPAGKEPHLVQQRAALADCRQAYGSSTEGFCWLYPSAIPGVDPKKVNFGAVAEITQFSFDDLLQQYAAGIKNPELVDIDWEVRYLILEPLYHQLGIGLKQKQAFAEGAKDASQHYATQEDWGWANRMGSGLKILIPLYQVPAPAAAGAGAKAEAAPEKKTELVPVVARVQARVARALAEQKARAEKDKKDLLAVTPEAKKK